LRWDHGTNHHENAPARRPGPVGACFACPQRGDVQALDQWVIAMALEELQPECVDATSDLDLGSPGLV